MKRFLLRRLLATVPLLIGVSIVAFSLSHLVPGDPVRIMLGERATSEDVERLRTQLGLDQPLWVQYASFLLRAVRGDLGMSIRSGRPVVAEIAERLPSTLSLAVASLSISVLGGILAGVVSATTRYPWVDVTALVLALFGLSMPTFWSGLLLILLFSLRLQWLPVTAPGWQGLLLPSLVLGAPGAAVLARMTRSTLLEVLAQDYIRTARAKGLWERRVVYRHALRNALVPVITIIGLQFGGRLGGAVIVESVFARPGLGRFAVTAILARDFPQVQGIVLVVAAMYVLVNTAVDILYGVIDPRIRVQ